MKTPDKRNMTKKDLAKYTKSELIEILNTVVFLVDPLQRNRYLERAVVDVEYSRQMKRIDESQKHLELAFDARMEANELLKPYEGKTFGEVPNDVMRKVAACMERAKREDAAYDKLQKEIDAYGKNA